MDSTPASHLPGRRDFLRNGACAVCASFVSWSSSTDSADAAPPYFDGCFITPAGYQKFRNQNDGIYSISDGLMAKNRHFRTTGDAALDRDLDRALGVAADIFSVNPAFGFYDPAKYRGSNEAESWHMNAWASSENTDISGTRGTVAFGWDLFHREFFEFDNSGLTIMAIAAHEFGHILQGDRGYLSKIRFGSPRRSEINADFLAGYFLGARKLKNNSINFRKAGELFIRLGRSGEGDPQRTHGNSKERLDAAETGFRVAYVEKKSLEHAVAAGLEYVGS